MKRAFLLNAAFSMAIPDLISRVYLASSVKMLPEQLKYSTFSGSFSSVTICTADGWLPSGSHYLGFFLHSFPFYSVFQFQLLCQQHCFFVPQWHKIVCMFHSANYLFSYSEVSRVFKFVVRYSLYKLNIIGDKNSILVKLIFHYSPFLSVLGPVLV